MKTCSKCGAQVADDAVFCTVCGFNFGAAAAGAAQPQGAPQPQPQPQPQYQQAAPVAPSHPMYAPVNPLDKFLGISMMFSCLSPLVGFFGFILGYFGGDVNGQRSDYLKFYSNQCMVFSLFSIIDAFLGWIPVVGWAWVIFRFVCVIIAIVNACKGETKPVLFFGTIKIIK